MSSLIVHITNDLWAEVNPISKIETIVLAAPVVIWGAGTVESTAKAMFYAVKIPFAALARYPTDEHIENLKSELLTAKGCVLLTGIGLIPLICKTIPYARIILRLPCYYPTYKSYEKISAETSNYRSFTHALERAQVGAVASQTSKLAERISENLNQQEYEELFQAVDEQYAKGVPITQGDLDARTRELHGSLIYRNWSYTVTYFTVKKTTQVVTNTVSFAWRNLVRIISSGYVTGAIKFAATEVSKEVLYTTDIPSMPAVKGVLS